ncbi:MAG: D-alanine--D-alanine ligase [Spirochaetales bacterium]|nr:D-alanine--D-alanine ligase [Spirochaetales bacterium]
MKKTICILYGGKSGEHEVSCQSAASISRHISKDKYHLLYIGIQKNGTWHVQPPLVYSTHPARGEMLEIIDNPEPINLIPGEGFSFKNKPLHIDFILPILHGTYGEDGTLQGMLDLFSIPYAGAGTCASAVCMDKTLAKRIFRDAGIPVVDFLEIRKAEYQQNPGTIQSSVESSFSYPCFIKPIRAGSSVGVSKATDRESLHAGLQLAFSYDSRVLVEKAINAREIECAVIGNDNPVVFTPGEVIPKHEFYSYDAKYLDPDGASLCIPADLSPEVADTVKKMASDAYKAATVAGFSRVDLFLDKHTGEVFLNEINTIPGFTHISMFPRMCEAGGLEYSKLIDAVIEFGMEHYRQEHENISYSLDANTGS